MPTSAAAVRRTLADLRTSPVLPRPDGEPWAALIARISAPGRAAEVTEETYGYFLDVLPPRWLGEGFMFAEGAEALRYFWKANGRYYCRQLTWDETGAFCAVAGVPVPD
jgi:hypothetical protein